MENESTSDDEDYNRVIFKYREEREEEEAEFEKHLEIALALSLSSDPAAVAIDQTDSSQQPKHSRRNRQFVSDATAHAVTQRSESNTMSFEEDESKYHPSGRRRSVELAEEMRRQMLEEEETQPHASGRRRSIEMAEEMRREMLNDSRTHHPSGRRRSVELAEDMRQQMLADQNGAAGYHPSGRRRSIEMAEDARQQMLRQTDSRTNDEEDVSRELEEMMRKGLIPPDLTQHSRPYNDCELFGYGGLSPQDPRVVGASDGQPRVPQRHRIDFKNPFQFGDDGFPVNWERSRIPDFGSEYLFNLVELVEGEDEYETIARDFHIADLDVRKIERLQNPHLLERYKGEMTQLIRRRGRDFDVNARYLYHGSASEKLILCEEGLDARLGMSGCFGKGIYFSDNPKKCIQYVSRSDVPYILMCRVMLGDAKIYQQGDMDRNLKREPEKENPTVGNKYYDSVRGRPVDFNEFVVYENRRAMIEYIITFQKRGTPFEDFSSSSKVGGAVAANAIEEESIEDHMARIQQVREEIRQTRAAERGEVYSGPTPAQRQKDRDVWRRVLKVTCPPGTTGYHNVKGIYDYLDQQEQEEKSSFTRSLSTGSAPGIEETNNNSGGINAAINLSKAHASYSEEADSEETVQLVMHHLVADFLNVTQTENVQMAKMYLERASMVLDQAILLYYEDEGS